MEREGAGTGAEDGSGTVRKGSEVDGRSLTFPSPPPPRNLVFVRWGWGRGALA